VGGTFTDVVALDARTRAVIAVRKVPTTHDHPDGVAAGIVIGLRLLIDECGIDPARIVFIAHSTTQATNALLEGDLARVGVVTIAGGAFGALAHAGMRFAPVVLAEGIAFAPRFRAIADADAASIDAALDAMAAEGVDAIAASEPFGVDRPARESAVVARARARGLAATSGHEVAARYGVRARTRTAALNAAILPRMLHAARTTARAAQDAGIAAPLMIMRSDGGVMDAAEVERRPILTLLSGPAAGVAGALLYENVTDGIFIEVGGTSADCSAIKGGRPQMRAARVGGTAMMLQTVDVRTLGVAGGSVVVLAADGSVRSVGPRSAHIAGYRYAAFATVADLAGARVAADGLAVLHPLAGTPIALTPTCAANLLGYVPDDAFARGDREAAGAAFARVAEAYRTTPEALAHGILTRAAGIVRAAVDALVRDYDLDRATVQIVGGGGGAAALVPFCAEAFALPMRLARDAHVISPIGVALALVRDVVERTIVDPTPADIVAIRREAVEAAVASGASRDRVEVAVDVDRAQNRVRATASGASTAADELADGKPLASGERLAAAVRHVRGSADGATFAVEDPELAVATIPVGRAIYAAVVDARGVVRRTAADARIVRTRVDALATDLAAAIERTTTFGDVGRAVPDVLLVYGRRCAAFAGLADAAQILALAAAETEGLRGALPITVLVAPRGG
jgi:N-methylhydantoinase A/oxoprolinase/acetone carboxylase beta subunit